MEVVTSQVPSPPSNDMDVYMATSIGGGSCVQHWVQHKVRSNSQRQSCSRYVHMKQSRFDFNDDEPCFNGFLRLGSWDLGPHVNRPLHDMLLLTLGSVRTGSKVT